MEDKKQNSELPESLVSRFIQSFGGALILLTAIVIIYILFLALFIKGTLSGWF